MSRPVPKPRRRLRSELLSLVPILAVPVAVAFMFPYEAVGFRMTRAEVASGPSCAFVSLAPGLEAQAMEVVRSAFSVRDAQARDFRTDLSLATLPEAKARPILSLSDREAVSSPRPLGYDVLPYPPSLAAPDPVALKPAPQPPVFPRDELLRLPLQPRSSASK